MVSTRRPLGVPLVIAIVALLGFASQSDAATVSSARGRLVFSAAPAEPNLVSISADVHGYQVVDLAATLTAGRGCHGHSRHLLVCNRTPGDSVTVLLGDQSDSADVSGLTDAAIIDGGAGDDLLVGGAGADTLVGGPGHDTVRGSGGDDVLAGGDDADFVAGDEGNDLLAGGQGNDELDGGLGDDQLNGGPGDDRLSGGDGTDEIVGADGNDVVNGGPGDDLEYGDAGADSLGGSDGSDELYGGADPDTLTGGAGPDVIYGGPGFDRVFAIDGAVDIVDCGGDTDTVDGDAFEQLTACPKPAPEATERENSIAAAPRPLAVLVPVPRLPVRIQFVRRHLLRVLVVAASPADVRVTIAFRDRHRRPLARKSIRMRTNRWWELSPLLPRWARTVEATCCR